MTKEELEKRKQVQNACKEGLESVGSAVGNKIKDDVSKDGIFITLLKGVGLVLLDILSGGK